MFIKMNNIIQFILELNREISLDVVCSTQHQGILV